MTLGAGGAHRAERQGDDRRGRRGPRGSQPECLAFARHRFQRDERAVRAVLRRRLLLQDLHGPVPRRAGCSTSRSSAAPPASAGRASSPTRTATRPRTPSATCLSWAAGRPGLSAALAAGRAGARVILCDEAPVLGGALDLEDRIGDGDAGGLAVRHAVGAERAAQCPPADAHQRLRLLRRQRAWRGRARSAVDRRVRQHAQRHWRIQARRVVLATGADRAALRLPRQRHARRHAGERGARLCAALRRRRSGARSCVFTNNDGGWQRAAALSRAGVPVRAVVDPRAQRAGRRREQSVGGRRRNA